MRPIIENDLDYLTVDELRASLEYAREKSPGWYHPWNEALDVILKEIAEAMTEYDDLHGKAEFSEEVIYLPSRKHGQFTATTLHEAKHDAECPCNWEK